MNKVLKFLSAILVLAVLIFAIGFKQENQEKICAFCDPSVLAVQKFYENEQVMALYTHKPIFEGHCLIIPKRHVERFEMLSDQEILAIGQAVKVIDQAVVNAFHTSAYLLLQKNGKEVGQTVPHVHFHYIPRHEGDDSTLKFLFKMLWANLSSPIPSSKMSEAVDKLKSEMQDNVIPTTLH